MPRNQKSEFSSADDCFVALRQAVKLAEVPCGPYPTSEGWEGERLANTRMVMKAYRAIYYLEKLEARRQRESVRLDKGHDSKDAVSALPDDGREG